ncbi:short integuments 2, mitochondrial [Nymphaea colorata]|nr:short integuments 2, mitochondrial [Nymphaea colorata]
MVWWKKGKKVVGESVLLGMKVGNGGLGGGGGGAPINWFPGHMAAATRAILKRLKLADLVIEVRDARIPLSSVNEDLQHVISRKRRVIALNKKDLANANIMQKWMQQFSMSQQDCVSINAHEKSSVRKLLGLVEFKLKEVISREPTLLVMVVGVPNVGKSSLINNIHQIASGRFPVQEKLKRATVGPLPGVTQDIAGYKIAHQPSIYVLDTPGVLVPSISSIETGLKLALVGSVKDSVVGEERLAEYLLATLNTREVPLHWKEKASLQSFGDNQGTGKKTTSKAGEDLVSNVQRALYTTYSEFEGDLTCEDDLECLIEDQLISLQKAMRIPQKAGDEARCMVSKKLLALFRLGKLGNFTLDVVPDIAKQIS